VRSTVFFVDLSIAAAIPLIPIMLVINVSHFENLEIIEIFAAVTNSSGNCLTAVR